MANLANPSGVSGIQGIDGYIIQDPEASPEDIHGGPANPLHAQYGEVAEPYPWQMTQYGGVYDWIDPIDGMVGFAPDTLDAGDITQDPTGDRTPYTHAAPWPKNPIGDGSISPENVSRQLRQNRSIHASNLGASYKHLYAGAIAQNDTWEEVWAVSPGSSSLEADGVPQQVAISAGGFGTRNRGTTQSPQNEYGYDSAHMHRRYATGSIPGNYMYLRPGSRPLVKSISRIGMRNFPVGDNTPFYGDDTGSSYDTYGAILEATPPEYIAPPQPMTDSQAPGSDPSAMGGTTDFGVSVW
jgi:hypothetical protein